jgi:hypothetical protein
MTRSELGARSLQLFGTRTTTDAVLNSKRKPREIKIAITARPRILSRKAFGTAFAIAE